MTSLMEMSNTFIRLSATNLYAGVATACSSSTQSRDVQNATECRMWLEGRVLIVPPALEREVVVTSCEAGIQSVCRWEGDGGSIIQLQIPSIHLTYPNMVTSSA